MFASTPPGSPEDLVPTALGLLAIPVLVAINGFFVAAEFALVAVRKTRVEELVADGVPRSAALRQAVDTLDDSVAAAQLGITLASLALGLVSEPALHDLLHPLFDAVPGGAGGPITRVASVALTLGLVTYLHVVFGEQMPKLAALQSAEKIALWIAPPLNVFARLTRPLIRVMNGSSIKFLHWIGFRGTDAAGHVHSVEELRLLVEDTEEAGLLDADQAEFVMNVFELTDKTVADVMVPRDKLAALHAGMKPDEILAAVREGAHTRMPVYDGALDNIVGVVNTKDLFYLFSLKGVVVLEDALYQAHYLPPDEPVSTALRLFKKTKHPMALVRDDAGAVVGLLTLEDVLEEIVGDIEDEHDAPPVNRRRVKPKK